MFIKVKNHVCDVAQDSKSRQRFIDIRMIFKIRKYNCPVFGSVALNATLPDLLSGYLITGKQRRD